MRPRDRPRHVRHPSDALEFGVWGGLTERERRTLLDRRPEVTAWRPILQAAMTRADGRT